jgi:hypothetical protein
MQDERAAQVASGAGKNSLSKIIHFPRKRVTLDSLHRMSSVLSEVVTAGSNP